MPNTIERDTLRTVRLAPYLKGKGPTFSLTLWDTHKRDAYGKGILGYSFKQGKTELFTGENYHCSPLHCYDSDATVAGLLGFLTLRKGDTDADYFKDYTPEQIEFSEQHAEALSCYCMGRFGEG